MLSFECCDDNPDAAGVRAALMKHDPAAEIESLTVRHKMVAGPVSTLRWLCLAASLVSGELRFRNMDHARGPELDNESQKSFREELGYMDLPVFKKASFICLRLGFFGIKIPQCGNFSKLKVLHLGCFLSPGTISIKKKVWPILEELQISRVRGLHHITVESDTLVQVKPRTIQGLDFIHINAPSLKVLNVVNCLHDVQWPTAKISAGSLDVFRWTAPYDAKTISFAPEMKCTKVLNPPKLYALGSLGSDYNSDCTNLMRRFPEVLHLELDLDISQVSQ